MENSRNIFAITRFEGKVAIVTGSTQGIGFSIAERLCLEGASVVVSSRKQENVDKAVKKLKEKGIQVMGVVCHVSNAQQRKNLLDATLQSGLTIERNWFKAHLFLAISKEVDLTCRVEIEAIMRPPPEPFFYL
ncbi:hypothetical protein TIFTF001_039702 [Ficus carica]|uniref:Uncharacterized protein n=1 Tax=Ficus carica TaxID=3494 RepID=A0AA88ECQ9_FICCA|nr:hypothetical protein TIFTF001_039702 [Ficus carica]